MADESSFLHRWSRRKLEAGRVAQRAPDPGPPPRPAAEPPAPAVAAAAPAPAPAPVEVPPLPAIDSLTLESDFSPFFSAKVDETVKRAAMRKLFSDPHFNVMDGLDIYIDDYSKPDPMPEGMLAKLADVYKTVEEKIVEPPAAETTAIAAQTPAAPAEAAPDATSHTTSEIEADTDERAG
jgi:hypothetical protein